MACVEDLLLDSPESNSIGLPAMTSQTSILNQILPYLTPASTLSLASTCRDLRDIVYGYPSTFRFGDLTTLKSLSLNDGPKSRTPSVVSMENALSADEIYSGPLNHVFLQLERKQWLHSISTMLLDGLTVPADLVRSIITDSRFNVRILSIREAKNLNQGQLCQILRYACRESRPVGTPRLRGLYVFGPKEPIPVKEEPIVRRRSPPPFSNAVAGNSIASTVAQQLNRKSQAKLAAELAEHEGKWYKQAGKIIERKPIPEWIMTMQACEGIIHFDAVLCRGPRHDPPSAAADTTSYLQPAIATVALGPAGCQKCKSCPEGPGIFGQSPAHHLPLLAPPPLHNSTLRSAQMPGDLVDPKLIVRCLDCLKNRWCERCQHWWCETCFEPGTFTAMQEMEQVQSSLAENAATEDIKVHMGLCVDSCLINDMMAYDGSGYENWPFLDWSPGDELEP
jgi:hypothetical protein